MTHLPDAIGTRHRRFHSPERARIASLVPSLTETLFALGLGDRVVARTGFCIHPDPAVREVPKVGGTKDVNVAKLLATEPTHVIVNIDENRRDTVEHLRRVVPHVVVTHPLTPEDNVALFALFGHVFAVADAAAAQATAFTQALQRARAVAAALPRESVLYLIWKDPWMTVARDTYVSAMLATVGWQTLPMQSERRYPELVAGDALWQQADRVLLSSEPYAFDERHVAPLIATEHPAGPITLIDGEMTSWYGSRATLGLDYLAALRRGVSALADAR
ncbi:MAG: ABC transporter substrate-binding protein [Burkholderiales bacterium]|nr:ABC transporter substrate-binding protein [Burkholderiales bacterium]